MVKKHKPVDFISRLGVWVAALCNEEPVFLEFGTGVLESQENINYLEQVKEMRRNTWDKHEIRTLDKIIKEVEEHIVNAHRLSAHIESQLNCNITLPTK